MNVPVTFHIPGALREFTAGRSKVEIENSPTTLAEALSALWTLYPGVRDRILTEQGQVREHTSTFSSRTKTSDIRVDSRAPSRPDLRFRSSPPLVVAERILVMCNQSQTCRRGIDERLVGLT